MKPKGANKQGNAYGTCNIRHAIPWGGGRHRDLGSFKTGQQNQHKLLQNDTGTQITTKYAYFNSLLHNKLR